MTSEVQAHIEAHIEAQAIVADRAKGDAPFMLFGGSRLYPSGGWGDFRGFYETREAAQAKADALVAADAGVEWWHVIAPAGLKVASGRDPRAYDD